MNDYNRHQDSQLPSTDSLQYQSGRSSFLGSIFGGDHVERRPLMLSLAVTIILLIGFIIGTLFTMGILNGTIEIDPKAIKAVIKSILGKP